MAAVCTLRRDIHRALPPLSPAAGAILDALLLTGGSIGSAAAVAHRLGLSRFALARMLARQGLPGLRELAGWISVLEWINQAERSRVPLFVFATRTRRSPAVCYRTVKRLTGLTWGQLKRRGALFAIALFAARCRGELKGSATRRPAAVMAAVRLRPVAARLASPRPVSGS
jgi:hypothetical protein